MIQTSYFSRASKLPNAVAISQGIPNWYNGARYKSLAPSWDIIHTKDPELYKKRYCQEVLSKLDPKQVATDLDGCILLCHEKDSTHCHRRIVAEWLEAALGIKVPEMGDAARKPRSLWDYEKKEEQAKDEIAKDEQVDNKTEIPTVRWQDWMKPDDPVGDPKLEVIYYRLGEDPSLGLNLYSGCSHDCLYCYNERTDRNPDLPYDKPGDKGVRHLAIERDLQKLLRARDIRPVFISAVGDPYDMGREDNRYTRIVLHTFQECKYPFYLLTKGGTKAVRDFDLYKPGDKFGCTLTFDNPEDSLKWEPGAALPADRIAALKEAHNLGIYTRVSIEPVIYPEQSLHIIEMSNDFVDLFSVGMLSHHTNSNWDIPEEWPVVDWSKFRKDVEALLKSLGRQQGTGYRLDYQLIDAK